MLIPISWIPYLFALPVVIIVFIILYYFVVQPKVLLPLSNEQDEGEWRIPLPQLGYGVNDGRVTTARRYVEAYWAKLIENAPPKKQEALIKRRDQILKYHLFAQRVGRDKFLYMFDKNPLEARFHIREDKPVKFGADVPMRFIYGVQDCMTIGKDEDGFEHVGIKLSAETIKFTSDERRKFHADLEMNRFVKLAALNVEAVSKEKQDKERYETLFHEALDDVAKKSGMVATRDRALANKDLLDLEPPVVKGRMSLPSAKQFFSWPQVAVALFTFLVTPNIMAQAQITYPDPQTVAVGLACITFMVTPFIRKLVGK